MKHSISKPIRRSTDIRENRHQVTLSRIVYRGIFFGWHMHRMILCTLFVPLCAHGQSTLQDSLVSQTGRWSFSCYLAAPFKGSAVDIKEGFEKSDYNDSEVDINNPMFPFLFTSKRNYPRASFQPSYGISAGYCFSPGKWIMGQYGLLQQRYVDGYDSETNQKVSVFYKVSGGGLFYVRDFQASNLTLRLGPLLAIHRTRVVERFSIPAREGDFSSKWIPGFRVGVLSQIAGTHEYGLMVGLEYSLLTSVMVGPYEKIRGGQAEIISILPKTRVDPSHLRLSVAYEWKVGGKNNENKPAY